MLRVLKEIPLKFNYGHIKWNCSRATYLFVEHVLLVCLVKDEITLLVSDLEKTNLGHGVK